MFQGPFRSWYTWDRIKRVPPRETLSTALEYILSIVEEEGPFDGIIGFSQGAALASTLLAHYSTQRPFDPRANPFKFAIFICGSRPFNDEGTRLLQFATDGQIIRIPTVHVIGARDQWYQESLELFKLCDAKTAKLYDHGQGHILPANRKVTMAIADLIRHTASRAFLTC